MQQKLVFFIWFLFGAVSVKAASRIITQELKSTPDGQLFYVEVKVGETGEQQTFNLLVATEYLLTWLPSAELNPERGYRNKSEGQAECFQYVPKTGTGYGAHRTWIHSDRVQIGQQVVVENQQFEVAYEDEPYSCDFPVEWQLDGMLGMSGLRMIRGRAEYLFRNLYSSSYIDHLQYSLYINNSAVPGEPKGALVFGGIDEKYYTGDINYVRMYEDSQSSVWEYLADDKALNISAIHLDWSRVELATRTAKMPASFSGRPVDLNSPPARLKLDSSTKLFVGDKKILDTIHLDFIGAKSVGQRGVYVFDDCRRDDKPDIVFMVDGSLELRLTPEDYVLEGDIEQSRVCFSAFKALERERPFFVLGTRFLRKYYTIFDYEKDLVGFATPK